MILFAQVRAEQNKVLKMFHAMVRTKVRRDSVSFNTARQAAYFWLAEQMNMKQGHCNISTFDHDQCMKALTLLSRYVRIDDKGSLL